MGTIQIDNTINVDDLWRGIGGHFDSLSQIFHELIDNSISNFRSNSQLNHRAIYIKFDTTRLSEGFVDIIVEDTGTGIKNINSAFTIGNKTSQETPMNEHGFGLKHALASANPQNDSWFVYTRTQDNIDANTYKLISSKYKIEDYQGALKEMNREEYPTIISNYTNTGTIIKFITTREIFNTIGRYGTMDPRKLMLYLKENLGYTYSGIISKGLVNINIILNDSDRLIVEAVSPWWKKNINPGESSQKVDLGELGNKVKTGDVELHYHFGVINKRYAVNPQNEVVLYYNGNMKNSGVEVRLNGRLIKNNIFTSIWDVQQHNKYNDFLVTIDLISDNIDSLPSTRSSKNGFREGDPRLLGLFSWIKQYCPEPYIDKNAREEYDLFNELKNIKTKQLTPVIDSPLTIETDYRLLKSYKEPIKIDLYVAFNKNVIIYHGKKEKTSVKDIYEMKMLWDACVLEGINPTQAIILATEHPASVYDFMKYNNNLTDGESNMYKINLKTWKDEGLDFPKTEI